MRECSCIEAHEPKLVVITGGPGAGKTTVLEVVRRHLCPHVTILPEAASILFGGGFPRDGSPTARRGGQRAIFFVERELERMSLERKQAGLVLCDRGTLDGVAYWPGEEGEFWSAVGSTRAQELARYHAVIHLRTPTLGAGYGHSNPLRIESVEEAQIIDDRLLRIWSDHPRRVVVENHIDFMKKVTQTMEIVESFVPACCRPRRSMAPAPARP